MKTILYILFLCAVVSSAEAKDVLKVYNRVFEKEYRYTNEFLLDLTAEKATVNIRVVEGSTVRIHLQQIAKNQHAEVARRELDYMHFVERKERHRLYLHNYVQIPDGSSRLSSIINNIYTIEVPKNCHLKIKNELGAVNVKGVSTTARFDLSYCGLTMNEMKGKVYVDSRVGDLTMNDCASEGEFICENVNMKLQRSKGSFDVQARFGQISCVMSEAMTLFNAKLEQCDITFINRTAIAYDYVLSLENGHFDVLDQEIREAIKKDDKKESLHLKTEQAYGTIIINSEYGDVNLY